MQVLKEVQLESETNLCVKIINCEFRNFNRKVKIDPEKVTIVKSCVKSLNKRSYQVNCLHHRVRVNEGLCSVRTLSDQWRSLIEECNEFLAEDCV